MRVLAVADVYEALTSARPRRPPVSAEAALAILHDEAPRRLDADAVAALEDVLRRPASPRTTDHHRCGIPLARPAPPALGCRCSTDPSVDHRVVAAARLVAAAIHAG